MRLSRESCIEALRGTTAQIKIQRQDNNKHHHTNQRKRRQHMTNNINISTTITYLNTFDKATIRWAERNRINLRDLIKLDDGRLSVYGQESILEATFWWGPPPLFVLDIFSESGEPSFRARLAENEYLSSGIFQKLLRDEYNCVRLNLAANNAADHVLLHYLSNDRDYGVRLNVAYNENTSPVTLRGLIVDVEPSVRKQAKHSLCRAFRKALASAEDALARLPEDDNDDPFSSMQAFNDAFDILNAFLT